MFMSEFMIDLVTQRIVDSSVVKRAPAMSCAPSRCTPMEKAILKEFDRTNNKNFKACRKIIQKADSSLAINSLRSIIGVSFTWKPPMKDRYFGSHSLMPCANLMICQVSMSLVR